MAFFNKNYNDNAAWKQDISKIHYFNSDEIKLLIAKAKEPLKTGIKILIYTGIRRAELHNLRRRDVDLKTRELKICPSGKMTSKGKKPRIVPIADDILNLLIELAQGKSADEYIFRPYKDANYFNRKFHELSKCLGMKGSLGDLRHTFASHLAMNGTPIYTIKELLGHSNIVNTLIYAHFSPNNPMLEVNKLSFVPIQHEV